MPELTTAKPRVSVVMSVYNDADRVAHAVQSILDQQFRDLELIVINDGSTDACAGSLDRLAAADPRLRIIHQENAGLTKALIRGCNEARGEFIARQDSDDWSHPLRIGEQVALLDSDERIGFVSCAVEYIGPGDEHLTYICRPTDPETATHGLLEKQQGPPAHGSVIFRKIIYEKVGGYRPEFYFAQDSDLWPRMAEVSHIGYCQEVLYEMRTSETSISTAYRTAQSRFGKLGQSCRKARAQGISEARYLRKARELTAAVIESKKKPRSPPSRDKHRTYYLVGSQLDALTDPRAAEYFWRTLVSRPWHLRAWYKLLRAKVGRLLTQFGRSQVPR